jgi:hypothetical protein
MSPITPNSKLGRIFKLKEKILQCLKISNTIIDGINRSSNSSTVRVNNTKKKLRALYSSINTIMTIWSDYLTTIIEPNSSLYNANNAVNISIIGIIRTSEDIKIMPINSDTLHLIADSLNSLKAEIIRVIINVANLYQILNTQDILRLATQRRPYLSSGRPGLQYRFTVPNELPLPLPPAPPPPTSLPIPTMNRFVPPPLTRQNNRNLRVILSPQTPPTLSNSSSSSSNSSTSPIPLSGRGKIYQKKERQLQTKKRKRNKTSHFRNTRNRTK